MAQRNSARTSGSRLVIRWRPSRRIGAGDAGTLQITHLGGPRYRVRWSAAGASTAGNREDDEQAARALPASGIERTGSDADPIPPPVGAPVDLRERLARALRTDDPALVTAAEADYRGVYESEHAYIAEQVAEHLQPPDMTWVLACCTPVRLREGYQGRALLVWSIALDWRACMVFETLRDSTELVRAVLARDAPREPLESPCPLCGATDWMIFLHTDDRELTALGCDRCLPSTPR